MELTIRKQLFNLAEPDYQQFSTRLLPGIDHILGVRVPILRKIAQKIAKGDWRSYLKTADDQYIEEIMLQGMVIGYAKCDVEERLAYISAFVPKINCWSVCDVFCNGLKFAKTNKREVWEFLQPYFSAKDEYLQRFAAVMLLEFFIDLEYIDHVLAALDQIKHEGYYVKMAVAWAISICYIKLPQPVMAYLKENALDDFTYNKALQKITESLRIDAQTKKILRDMKRK